MTLLLLLFLLPAYAQDFPEKLRLERDSVTVSGISSGAFMAVQLQVALSSRIKGTGTVAGGTYWCAEGKAARAVDPCMVKPQKISVPTYTKKARLEAANGKIDSTANLSHARIFLFQSEADSVVKRDAGTKLRDFFKDFVPDRQVRLVTHKSAEHGFPTLTEGNPCNKKGQPWILNCGLDLAGEMLNFLYSGSQEPAESATGALLEFNQDTFGGSAAGLLPKGFLYIPEGCRIGSCGLHIALHGCEMSSEFIGSQFAEKAGYNRWADAKKLVVVYPQAAKSRNNPQGCWDWFGHTGKDYALKNGPQIRFFSAMISSLVGDP